jgi:hypothetical protein
VLGNEIRQGDRVIPAICALTQPTPGDVLRDIAPRHVWIMAENKNNRHSRYLAKDRDCLVFAFNHFPFDRLKTCFPGPAHPDGVKSFRAQVTRERGTTATLPRKIEFHTITHIFIFEGLNGRRRITFRVIGALGVEPTICRVFRSFKQPCTTAENVGNLGNTPLLPVRSINGRVLTRPLAIFLNQPAGGRLEIESLGTALILSRIPSFLQKT